MATKREIMLACLRQLSMVYGTATNRYAEEKLYSMIDDALEYVFKLRFWDCFIKKVKTEVTNGYPIIDNLNKVIREFNDIQTVMNNQSYPRELSKANISVIKPAYTGTVPMFYQRSDISDKSFQVIPPASGVSVWVIFRTLCKPEFYDKFVQGVINIDPANRRFEYLPEDEIPFDDLAIRYRVCWQYMMLKMDNDKATQMYQGLFAERIAELEHSETNSTMSYETGPQQSYQHGWWTE